MPQKNMEPGVRFWIFRRGYALVFPIVECIVRLIYRMLWFFSNTRPKLPQITNEVLLESAASLAEKIRTKQLRSVDVVEAYIQRLQEVQPILNIYTDERFVKALKEAHDVDTFLNTQTVNPEQLKKTKPLLGVPFTTKNAIAAKGLRHDSGSVVRRDVVADQDADSVGALKGAGAILLCVTNVPELCSWIETYNKIHGTTNNPYDLSRTAGGSTGGDASAIGAAASLIAIGSDIAGSIRVPAYCCGIFGHRTTPKNVPSNGHFPFAPSEAVGCLAAQGPMCRYASDLKLVLSALTRENPQSNLQLNKPVNLENIRYHFVDNFRDCFTSKVSTEIANLVQKVSCHLSNGSAVKADLSELKFASSIYVSYTSACGMPRATQRFACGEPEIFLTKELLKSIVGRSNHILPSLYVCLFEKIQYDSNSAASRFLRKQGEDLQRKINDLLRDDGVLICPVMPTTALYHTETLFRAPNFGYAAIFNYLGLPGTSCPVGLSSDGLPLGIQVIANKNQDRLCLAVAEQIEKEFGGWKLPSPS